MTAWSCDDATLTTALSDATLCVWDSKSCKTIYRLKGHKVSSFKPFFKETKKLLHK